MIELLTAIPNLFNAGRESEYARLVQSARAPQLSERAMRTTHLQFIHAFETVVRDAKEKNHPGKKPG